MAEEDKHSSRSSRHTSSGSSRKRSEKDGEEEAKPDDGISRSERRKREERDAKRKTRSGGSSQASTPGAVAATGDHKSRSKSPKKTSDSKNKLRLAPGADGEKSSSRSSKQDAKDKERRGTRATKPGAEVASSSRDRPSRKKSGNGGVPVSPLGASARSTVSASVGGQGEHLAAAMIVEEEKEEEKEDEDFKREREEARIQAMVDAKTNKAIQQMQEEEKEKKRKAKNKRNKIICVLIILALIGGGVGAYFALTGKEPPTPQEQQETLGPSADPSSSPSLDLSFKPSTAPSKVELKYPEPTLEECVLIANGLKIPGEDEMFVTTFAIPMEVTLESGNDIDSLMNDVEIAIEKYLVPDLIGCSRELFRLRQLGHPDLADTNVPLWSDHQRHLQSVASNRWAIAKAIVEGTVNSGACEYSSSPDCTVVTATMVLRVRGEERIVDLAPILGLIFPFKMDIQPDLQLDSPFASVVVAAIKSLEETAPPSISPTGAVGAVSQNPSGFPSSSPSTSPSSAPVIGPTSPAPTRPPTKSPSKAPTSSPSIAPTPTPRPTLAPQPGPSPPPTPLPTKSPTISPSKRPSPGPSSQPSLALSASPSKTPSKDPSSKPSLSPSVAPSSAPSTVPSSSPTMGPRLGFVPLLRQGMVAEKSSAYMNDMYGEVASNALDGNYNTHFLTNTEFSAWWKVQVSDYYGSTVSVNQVTIWNRQDDCAPANCQARLIGATVRLRGEDDSILATSSPLTADIVQTVDFGEVSGVASIQVIANSTTRDYFSFSEIEAWGNIPNDVNQLGYKGLLYLDMDWETSTIDWSNLPGGKALDGNFESIFHTRMDYGAWWKIIVSDYYGQTVTVSKVTIWNRPDECGTFDCPARLAGAVVKLFGAGDTVLATSSPLTRSAIQTVDFGEVSGVAWIQVKIDDLRRDYLHFAEIDAWGKVE